MSEENNPIDGFMGQSMKREEISPRKESSGGGGGQDSSRKRKYDSDNHRSGHSNNGSNKRSNMSSSSRGDRGEHRGGDEEEEVYLKMMIPAPVAGGVIGRGGDKIGQIQKEAQVRMKMSKNNEHYPGTQERVCLIIGSVKSVLKAHAMVVERMQEKDEKLSHRDSDLQDRVNQIKILIPNTTAGFLIGKSGGTIKQIKDDSGAHVQISSKQTDLPERVVTIEGDSDRRNKALSMIVRKIAEDPQHSSEPTLSYSSLSSGIGGSSGSSGGSNMSGNVGAASAYDHYGVAGIQSNQVAAVAALQNATQKLDMNAAAYYMSGLNNLALLIINCGGSYQMTAENLKLSLRNAGYSSQASAEILEAITIMLNYGLITKNSPAALLAANPSLANLINLGQVGLANISSALAASIGATGGGGNPMAAMTAASGGQGVVNSHGGPSPQHQQQYYQNGSGSVAGSGIGKRR